MTDYTKMSKKNEFNAEELLEQIGEIIPENGVVKQPTGKVTCGQLYVRSEPTANAEPLGIIKRDDIVTIYEDESTEEFYNVCTESGLDGFCMKKFITVL